MTTRSKNKPWSKFIARDDRGLLKELANDNWASHRVLERIPGMVFSALRSLHFSRSNRWGVVVSLDKMKPLALQFLEWKRTRGEWEKHQSAWSKQKGGPWSLPYCIFRSYYRFRRSEFPKGIRGEVSYSGQKSLLENTASLEKIITAPLLDAFSFVTFSLPEPLQLPYQLHLEGLITEEISSLLNRPVKEINSAISEAKGHLNSGYGKMKESA
jgi:hypothetical protein